MNDVLLAQLIVYAIVLQPVLYIAYRHGLPGILGWGCLIVFCTVRIVGGGMGLKTLTTAAYILNSIGTSPLILTVDGVLHEANVYRNPRLNKSFHWLFFVAVHMVLVGGVVVAAIGAAGIAGSSHPPSTTDISMMKAGMAVIFVCWIALAVWGVCSLLVFRRDKNAPAYREGSLLLHGTLISLLFIGIRVLYSLISVSTQDASLNPITGKLSVRVVLGFLSELVAVLVFLFVGFRSRMAVWRARDEYKEQQDQDQDQALRGWEGGRA